MLCSLDPVESELKADSEPYTLVTPCHFPFPLVSKIGAELLVMLALSSIEEVTETTECCYVSIINV